MLSVISEIFVLTFRALRVVEIVYRAALGAGLLRRFVVERLALRKEKFEFTAFWADININLQAARNEIKKIIYYRSNVGEFYAFIRKKLHFFSATETFHLIHNCD